MFIYWNEIVHIYQFLDCVKTTYICISFIYTHTYDWSFILCFKVLHPVFNFIIFCTLLFLSVYCSFVDIILVQYSCVLSFIKVLRLVRILYVCFEFFISLAFLRRWDTSRLYDLYTFWAYAHVYKWFSLHPFCTHLHYNWRYAIWVWLNICECDCSLVVHTRIKQASPRMLPVLFITFIP